MFMTVTWQLPVVFGNQSYCLHYRRMIQCTRQVELPDVKNNLPDEKTGLLKGKLP